jgi:hypothetical protein
MLLLSIASCGVFAKFSKRTKHEVAVTIADSSRVSMATETITTGDSVVHIPSTSISATVPLVLDTNHADLLDSIVSDGVTIYYKTVYSMPADGTMLHSVPMIKGLYIKAVTPAKTYTPNYKVQQRSTATIATAVITKADSTRAENVLDKKRDNRLGGYTAIILSISLLCVGMYVAKNIYSFKNPL